MLAKLSNFFKPMPPKDESGFLWTAHDRSEVELLYTDAMGYKYYKLVDSLSLSMNRSIAAQAAVRMAEFCMTKEKLLELCDKMDEASARGQMREVFVYMNEIRNRTMFAAEEETLMGLACVYSFLEHEPLNQYSPWFQDRKKKLWSQDADARGFFLEMAWTLTIQYSSMSDLDILTYLRNSDLVRRGHNLK